jgi:hypothetical protein
MVYPGTVMVPPLLGTLAFRAPSCHRGTTGRKHSANGDNRQAGQTFGGRVDPRWPNGHSATPCTQTAPGLLHGRLTHRLTTSKDPFPLAATQDADFPRWRKVVTAPTFLEHGSTFPPTLTLDA